MRNKGSEKYRGSVCCSEIKPMKNEEEARFEFCDEHGKEFKNDRESIVYPENDSTNGEEARPELSKIRSKVSRRMYEEPALQYSKLHDRELERYYESVCYSENKEVEDGEEARLKFPKVHDKEFKCYCKWIYSLKSDSTNDEEEEKEEEESLELSETHSGGFEEYHESICHPRSDSTDDDTEEESSESWPTIKPSESNENRFNETVETEDTFKDMVFVDGNSNDLMVCEDDDALMERVWLLTKPPIIPKQLIVVPAKRVQAIRELLSSTIKRPSKLTDMLQEKMKTNERYQKRCDDDVCCACVDDVFDEGARTSY